MIRHWQSWLILSAVILIATAPMLERSYPITHSTHFNLSWALQYQYQFFAGQPYPRWLEFSNFGFGNATFVFYPPLCMVATLPFRALGIGLAGSLIGSMALAMVVLAGGLYRYSDRHFPRWIAILVAALGVLSPYFLVDIYQRGSLGEVWAIALIPWITLATENLVARVNRQPQPPALPEVAPETESDLDNDLDDDLDNSWESPISWQERLQTAVSLLNRPSVQLIFCYSLLVLSHLPTLLIFTLVWLPFPAWIAAPNRRREALIRSYAAVFLSGGLTAYFLIPVVLDGSSVQLRALYSSPDYLPQNRLMLSGVWQLNLQLTQHWFDRGLIPLWGVLVAVTLVAAIASGVITWGQRWWGKLRQPPQLRLHSYWLFASAVGLLMTTDLLGWLYEWTYILQGIQFSWRWLALPGVYVPLLLGYWLSYGQGQPPQHPLRRGAMALMMGLWVMAIFSQIIQGIFIAERAVYDPSSIAQFARLSQIKALPESYHLPPGEPFLNWHWRRGEQLALVDVYEYRAKWVNLEMPPRDEYPLLAWQDGTEMGLVRDRWAIGERSFSAENTTVISQAVELRTFDYPAWFVRLDDGAWRRADHTGNGRIRVWIPPGVHQVTVRYRGTFAEHVGFIVSSLTALWLVTGSLLNRVLKSSSLVV
ncbi:hypothetical protein [Sodalinema gerasimenkoae]|uniref:hypothetical protein n=1 Tax=Sodalinema gerasimenkoae TaxID=2862348 RepID=UPI0013577074|nr:hypothetical protein [Sodalinema gerasimenkoae]